MARSARGQRGAALLILAVMVALGGTYFILSRLNSDASILARQRAHNAAVLSQARQALVGYVAMRAAQSGENDPGALPCPEAPGYYNIAPTEGTAAGNCSLPAVGRLPWRTLGLDKLVDASGEPLWYVVSPGWAKPNSTTNTIINSNSAGQLAVDGNANDSVALIIAPGSPLPTQVRNAVSATAANYLDGENATPDAVFVTSSAAGAFNDQVLRVTTRDILPALEAAIAQRIDREIVPLLQTVYASPSWGVNISATNPVYPFPAPFADPSLASSFTGSATSCAGNACQGLFPAVFGNTPGTDAPCVPGDGPLCDPGLVRWTGGTAERTGGSFMTPNTVTCSVVTTTVSAGPPATDTTRLDCVLNMWSLLGILPTTVDFRVQATASNVGMALRQLNSSATMTGAGVSVTSGPTATLNADGSATVTINGRATIGGSLNLGSIVSNLICGISGLLTLVFDCREVTVSVPISFLSDHPLLDSRAHAPAAAPPVNNLTGWFVRNQWYRVLYYAAAQGATPLGRPNAPNCIQGSSCLTLNGGANDKRTLLLLAGRSLGGTVGNSRPLADYLDSTENRDGNAVFATQPASARFNDRAIVVQND